MVTRPSAPAEGWERISGIFSAALIDHFVTTTGSASSETTHRTIEINTTLVPKRGDNLLRWLRDVMGLESVAGLRMLEVGSGFGALATYLAWKGEPEHLTAVDVTDAYLAIGQRASDEAALSVEFRKADMRDLTQFGDGSFDVIVVNNTFIYLTSGADAQTALGEFARVLRPGGVILFHHANKWQLRDPFTRSPFVHLLSPRLARPVSRVTGWKHSHPRVRLLSPVELRRRLERAGFSDIRFRPAGRVSGRLRNYASRFYVMGARKPSST
jgi:ubiquinone/menaquinone biosynthesis C-methylase UbiE